MTATVAGQSQFALGIGPGAEVREPKWELVIGGWFTYFHTANAGVVVLFSYVDNFQA